MTTPIIILALLTAPWLLVTLASRLAHRDLLTASARGCLGITFAFCFTGAGHFVETQSMVAMLPYWVPARIPLIYVTGVVEIVAAIAVLIPSLRRLTGWCLILMLVMFLPVNIYAALNYVAMGGHEWGPVYLLIRVPLQVILIGWTWWFAARGLTLKPIRFHCDETLAITPEEIAQLVLDVRQWSTFKGYGVVPGIEKAEFEITTPEVTGSRIRVTSTDGSNHIEEIVEWRPDHRLRLRMVEFSPPLSRFANRFDETWTLERKGKFTKVIRSFELHAKSVGTRPFLWLISVLIKKAIDRQLREMRELAAAK